jgi:hypothetical protein
METTTIRINSADLQWWKDSCLIKNMDSPELFSGLREAVKNGKRQEFYKGLVMPSGYKKPLASVRVDKKSLGDKFVQRFENKQVKKEI